MPATGRFQAIYIKGATEADFAQLEEEVVGTALGLARDDPAIGALVLECTNLAPFSQSIRQATGLPVSDLNTLAMQAYQATRTPRGSDQELTPSAGTSDLTDRAVPHAQ